MLWGDVMFAQVPVVEGFFRNECGAITLDWVALTSSVVVIGIGLVYMVYGGEAGAISTMVTNYNGELSTAADNLSNVALNKPAILD